MRLLKLLLILCVWAAPPISGMVSADQATLLQKPSTVGGYRDALWGFTCTYQPATFELMAGRS
jgi:hypothetical protein